MVKNKFGWEKEESINGFGWIKTTYTKGDRYLIIQEVFINNNSNRTYSVKGNNFEYYFKSKEKAFDYAMDYMKY